LLCGQVCSTPAALHRLAALAVDDDVAVAAQASLSVIVQLPDATRAAAARAAIDAVALPLLRDAAQSAQRRSEAALTAALSGRREAMPMLIDLVAQPPGSLAARAALALGGIPDPAAVAALARASERPDTRGAACQSLTRLAAQQVAGAADATQRCTAPQGTPTGPGGPSS
ncbi:MAG: hypothetical protein ABI629_25475, partial [bacterium]